MLKKTLSKFKKGNKKDRHWVLFSMFIFSWLIGIIGLAMVKYNLQGLGKLIAIFGVFSGIIFVIMGFWNMLFGPDDENKK